MASEMHRETRSVTREKLRRGVLEIPWEAADNSADAAPGDRRPDPGAGRTELDRRPVTAAASTWSPAPAPAATAAPAARRRGADDGHRRWRTRPITVTPRAAPRPQRAATLPPPGPRRADGAAAPPKPKPHRSAPARSPAAAMASSPACSIAPTPETTWPAAPPPRRRNSRPRPAANANPLDSLTVDIARLMDRDLAAPRCGIATSACERKAFNKRLHARRPEGLRRGEPQVSRRSRLQTDGRPHITEFRRLLDDVARDERGAAPRCAATSPRKPGWSTPCSPAQQAVSADHVGSLEHDKKAETSGLRFFHEVSWAQAFDRYDRRRCWSCHHPAGQIGANSKEGPPELKWSTGSTATPRS